jgi:hypothetical protein
VLPLIELAAALIDPPACQAVTEDVEVVEITGTLERRDGWVALVPDPPVCIALRATPTPYDQAARYGEIDVMLTGGWEGVDAPYGERVTARGRLAGAHTDDHHTDVLIVVLRSADLTRAADEGR